jgi:hypothetical protein
MCFETDKFRSDSSTLSLIVLYGVSAISLSEWFSLLYCRITAFCVPVFAMEAGLDENRESLLYFTLNLVSGFLNGIAAGVSKRSHKISGIDGTAIAYSVAVWFVSAALMGWLGFLFARKSRGKLSFDSTPEAIATTNWTVKESESYQ